MGNLIAALILGRLAQSTYYIVMTIAAFCGTSIFLFLRKPRTNITYINASDNLDIKLDKTDEGNELPIIPASYSDPLMKIEPEKEANFVEEVKGTF